MINIVRRWLARLMPPAPPMPIVLMPVASEPLVLPEPVTDPLDPRWRPDGEYQPPRFYESATPSPPTWAWASFTEAWPIVDKLAQ